jgi:hypothetical protein
LGNERDLLVDQNGDYLGDDEAIFADKICGNGDTQGINKFIEVQLKIIGDTIKDIAKYFPDVGHLVKGMSNECYNIIKKVLHSRERIFWNQSG